jgi:very-short-patch-repair endonuclease
MTLPEVLLWQQLRKRPSGLRFRRQFPVGGYVLDFACLDRRLAIEIDGESHHIGDKPQRDERRDVALSQLGFETLRIAARDVLEDLDAALRFVVDRCESRPLHHASHGPPPRPGEDLR